jgi:hypothetical protein
VKINYWPLLFIIVNCNLAQSQSEISPLEELQRKGRISSCQKSPLSRERQTVSPSKSDAPVAYVRFSRDSPRRLLRALKSSWLIARLRGARVEAPAGARFCRRRRRTLFRSPAADAETQAEQNLCLCSRLRASINHCLIHQQPSK